ncbi:hypothetical protein EG240_07220 [Paenimyroides tangerinum]|uniref:VCBS repeat-containing protein n=1 Tax=Paenimyroides tangerinum TaxID=2488728 RepID=A0A3P3W8F3_9FLAO|nr:hypothetical protein [Paenimyroides tangerinum]RRJ90984.1 hypothetical protein EG240_07220 [Paenimyroides tangerinum]
MKKNIYLCILALTLSTNSIAQKGYLEQIPKNWKIILETKGDLNKDNIEDLVLIVENTDKSNFIQNDGLGLDTLNINPRGIMIFFKDKDHNYNLIEENFLEFIPSQNDTESTCLADPLMENGGIQITKNVLKINFNYWLSCGSWYANNVIYTFRHQNNSFEMIGFDHSEYHRASGESSSTSINYSTKKKEETTGLNYFEESNPKTKTNKIKIANLYKLKDCTNEIYFTILETK